MARVRETSFGSGVRLNVPGPSGRLSEFAPDEAFGLGVANSLSKVGAQLFAIGEQHMIRRERAVARESYYNAFVDASDLFFSTEEGTDGLPTGLFARQGKHAFDTTDRAKVELQRIREHHMNGLKSEEAQQVFARQWEAHEAGLLKQASVHQAKETNRYTLDTAQAGASMLAQKAASEWYGNDDMVGQIKYQYDLAIQEIADLQGMGAEQAAELHRSATDRFVKTLILANIDGDPASAKLHLEAYKDDMSAETYASLAKPIDKDVEKVMAQRKADRLRFEHPGEVEVQLKAANKLEGDERDLVRNELITQHDLEVRARRVQMDSRASDVRAMIDDNVYAQWSTVGLDGKFIANLQAYQRFKIAGKVAGPTGHIEVALEALADLDDKQAFVDATPDDELAAMFPDDLDKQEQYRELRARFALGGPNAAMFFENEKKNPWQRVAKSRGAASGVAVGTYETGSKGAKERDEFYREFNLNVRNYVRGEGKGEPPTEEQANIILDKMLHKVPYYWYGKRFETFAFQYDPEIHGRTSASDAFRDAHFENWKTRPDGKVALESAKRLQGWSGWDEDQRNDVLHSMYSAQSVNSDENVQKLWNLQILRWQEDGHFIRPVKGAQ